MITPYEQTRDAWVGARLMRGSRPHKMEVHRCSGARDLVVPSERSQRVQLRVGTHSRSTVRIPAGLGFLALHRAGSEPRAGTPFGLRHRDGALNLELRLRLSDHWSMRPEVIASPSEEPQDLTCGEWRRQPRIICWVNRLPAGLAELASTRMWALNTGDDAKIWFACCAHSASH